MKNVLILILACCAFSASAQAGLQTGRAATVAHKYRVSLPVITLPQLATKSWDDRTHTQHIELHIKRSLDDKNIIGLKLATWRLFQPMGIVWWDGLLDKIESESEFYPGHVRESGVGITYQRMLWKGLFATVEVLPQFKTYLDAEGEKVGDGFKLYNSYHLGYHFAFGKQKRFFIEPQVHCQHWMFDTGTPQAFKAIDDKWRDYFLFEPNLYFGIKF
ncbi:hypothetical protein [Phaeodactylibacter luteus]|uniref:DUF3575 domain-containing protein n=1 Tax=Phaeodactylibacter luteus TaxID=1564516 RepID=A0A5C6S184_9BACT|nr:hypothetical protein [Phaeodactylibacter luteus]TXB68368.1 hypothetical protein FRY97_03025 [Phaeodactylibacter luteus]